MPGFSSCTRQRDRARPVTSTAFRRLDTTCGAESGGSRGQLADHSLSLSAEQLAAVTEEVAEAWTSAAARHQVDEHTMAQEQAEQGW